METKCKLRGFFKCFDGVVSFISDKEIKYLLKIEKGIEYMDLILREENGFETYEIRKTTEELRKVKFLSILEFTEIYEEIKTRINNGIFEFSETVQGGLNLSFNFLIFSKSFSFNFILNKAELDPNKLINVMKDKISFLYNKNQEKEQEIIILKERIMKLEDRQYYQESRF
jgi:hypothetical protein